jgi:hypothetical protein
MLHGARYAGSAVAGVAGVVARSAGTVARSAGKVGEKVGEVARRRRNDRELDSPSTDEPS